MDLVDERRAGEVGHESDRIAIAALAGRLVVEREGGHRMLVCRDVADERGLADLPCSTDEDDPASPRTLRR